MSDISPPGGDALLSEAEDYLEHYGVPGMKWGVIRDRTTSAAKSVGSVRSKVTPGRKGMIANKEIARTVNRKTHPDKAARTKARADLAAEKGVRLQSAAERHARGTLRKGAKFTAASVAATVGLPVSISLLTDPLARQQMGLMVDAGRMWADDKGIWGMDMGTLERAQAEVAFQKDSMDLAGKVIARDIAENPDQWQ